MHGVPPSINNIQQMLNMKKHSLTMDKLKTNLFDLLASNPNYSFTPSQFPILENALLNTFSLHSHKTPAHPPYCWMIQASIVKLNEEHSLTTEKMISEDILKTYQGLPRAHTTFLKHHLDKLCRTGDLACNDDGTYNVPGRESPKTSRKLLKLRLCTKTKENEVVEEANVALDEVAELSDSQVDIQEDHPRKHGRRKRKRRRSYIFDEEEDEHFEKRIVDGQGNRNKESGKEMVLLLKAGDVECESNELEQLNPRNPEEDHDLSKELNLGDSRGGNMLRVSSESAIVCNLEGDCHENDTGNLILSPVVVDPLVSVSNIEGDVIGSTIEKSDLKEAESNPSASELMIVPYVRATGKLMISLSNSQKRVIVCGLYNATEAENKEINKRQRGQRSRKTKVKKKKQSSKLKGGTPRKGGSVKQLGKPTSSDPIGLENIFMADEEPLSEVYEKCGNLKKHDMQRAKEGAKFPKELPSSECFVEVTPTVEKKIASTKEKENQYMQLRSQDTNCVNVEDNTIRKSSSSYLGESGSKDSERTENQWPVITKSNEVELYSQPFEHPIYNKVGSQHEGDQCPEQKNKDDQERPLVLIEATPEDKLCLSDSHNQLLEHTSHQHPQQPNEPLKNSEPSKRGPGRPRKEKSPMKDASDPSSSPQKNKSPKQDGGVRTRKLRETKKEPHLNEQERPSEQNKKLGKVSQGRPGKLKATTEDATRPQGRSKRKKILDCQQEDELCESGNHQQSQHQNKELKRVAKIQKQDDKVDEALTSLSHEKQDGMCGQASDHHSVSPNSQPRNNSRAQSSVEGASRATDNPKHGDVVEASQVIPDALSAQGQVAVKDQTQARRQSTRNLEPAKPLLDSQSDNQHDQKTLAWSTPALQASDNHCPEKVSVYLENEVRGKSVELEQEKWPLDNKTHTPLSNNSNDCENPDESYDHDHTPEKMEVQVKVPKELTAKSVPIHVPLGRQLRSRTKQYSQDSA